MNLENSWQIYSNKFFNESKTVVVKIGSALLIDDRFGDIKNRTPVISFNFSKKKLFYSEIFNFHQFFHFFGGFVHFSPCFWPNLDKIDKYFVCHLKKNHLL